MIYAPLIASPIEKDEKFGVVESVEIQVEKPVICMDPNSNGLPGHLRDFAAHYDSADFFCADGDVSWFRYCNLICRINGSLISDCMPQGFDKFPFHMLIHKQKHYDGRDFICFDAEKLPQIDRPSILGGHYAIGIFGHFIIDLLSTVLQLREHITTGELDIATFGYSGWMYELLALIGINNVSVYDTRAVRLKHGIVTPAVSGQMTARPGKIVADLYDEISNRTRDPRTTSRSVYFSRGNDPKRRFANEGEIRTVLSEMGFGIIDPTTISIQEQCAIAANANLIIGMFGSSLALAPLMKRGSKLLEITPPNQHDAWLVRLSSLRGIEHYVYVTQELKDGATVIDTRALRQFILSL